MKTEVSDEKEIEGGSGKFMVMAQQSRVGPRGSDGKNPNDKGEESLMVGMTRAAAMNKLLFGHEKLPESKGENSTVGETLMRKEGEEESGKRSDMQWHLEEPMEPVPDFYLSLPPEYRQKLMKHNTARAAAMNKLLFGHEKLLGSKRSDNSVGGLQEEAENELGKRLEMMTISHERQLYGKIQRALSGIEYRWTNKKMDKETMQLLNDISNKLDLLDRAGDDDESDEIDDGDEPLGKKTIAEEMADEAESFASYRRLWEYKHGKTCGLFTDITVLSSMQFTHYTPGRRPYSGDCYAAETLQIISIKLTELAGGLELPLSVYGVVAVRDMVDRNRNILFFRDRSEAQELKQKGPLLHLFGPSRAVVFTDKVWIEIELRVKGGAYSQDKDLISCARCYTGWNGPGVSTICFKNVLCTLELCLQPVKQTVQATILGVQVARSRLLKHGGLVACSPLSGRINFIDDRMNHSIDPSTSQIVLIESKDEAMPKGEDGYVHLWRQVVSVELKGRLDVVIKAYSKSGDIAAETCVPFYPKVCNISQQKCSLGDAEVAVTVAWSLVATNKTGLNLELRGRRCV